MVQPWVLHALDSTLSLTVFFPSMLFYWRGLWDLYGVYFFPDDEVSSNWAVFGLGCVGYLGYFLHPGLGALMNAFCRVDDVTVYRNEALPSIIENQDITSSSSVELFRQSSIEISECRKRLKKVIYFVVTRTYLYLYAVAGLAYWRGGWLLIDYYTYDMNYFLGCLVGFIVCYSALLVLRSTRTLSFPVFDVYLDTSPNLLVPGTRFNTKLNFQSVSSFAKYVADSMFTYFIINTLSLATWRSALGLYWVILAFDNPLTADVVSTVIGVGCCVLLLATETYIAKFAARWHGWRRLVVDDVITLAQFISESLMWYGTWNLNAQFIIPDPFLGGWVNHAIGTFLMMSLQIFSFVATIGCVIDFPDDSGYWRGDDRATVFHTKYLRKFRYFKRNSADLERGTTTKESSH